MFTIKHILDGYTSDQVTEHLYAGERVTFSKSKLNIGALEIRTGDTLVAALWGGMAYVMNEHGKTVARYDLPDDPHLPGSVKEFVISQTA